MKRRLALSTVLITIMLLCFGVTQLQPALVEGLSARDGTFGLRPLSDDCAGLRLAGEKLAWLPDGESEWKLVLFTFRYELPADPSGATFCLGQDLRRGP